MRYSSGASRTHWHFSLASSASLAQHQTTIAASLADLGYVVSRRLKMISSTPIAALVAGTECFWSGVRIEQVTPTANQGGCLVRATVS